VSVGRSDLSSGALAVGESLAAAGVGLFIASDAGRILWSNAAFDSAFGGSRSELLSDLLEGGWGTKGTGGSPWPRPGVERVVRVKGEPPRYFNLVTAPWPEGARLGILMDCTDRVLLDQEREERELYLACAAQDSADAFVSIDNDDLIRQWNDGARQMFGYSAEEVLGRRYDELLVPPELRSEGDLHRIDELMARDGFLRGHETVRMSKEGRQIPVEVTVTRFQDAQGRPAGRTVIYRDIGERHRLETALRKTVAELKEANHSIRRNQERLIALEKLSAIGEMSARVAHEIRTPLVTIGGFANTLLREIPSESPGRQYLEIIREEVRRLEMIVSEILEYVRPPRTDYEECDLNEILKRTQRPFEETMADYGIEPVWRLMEGLPRVKASGHQIHQVFTNLMQNAVQAMPGGGTLTVTTSTGPNHVLVSVADTGIGIPESEQARIFKPFFTTKPSGSGLGLAIASQIVVQHNGTISFRSAAGRGTTFEVRLPFTMEASQ